MIDPQALPIEWVSVSLYVHVVILRTSPLTDRVTVASEDYHSLGSSARLRSEY